MTKKAIDCIHETVMFNSGDFYLTCTQCNAVWSMGSSYKNNLGNAANLSGEVRTIVNSNYKKLYDAANLMMGELGSQGHIRTRSKEVELLIDILHDIDGGVYRQL